MARFIVDAYIRSPLMGLIGSEAQGLIQAIRDQPAPASHAVKLSPTRPAFARQTVGTTIAAQAVTCGQLSL
jgi:hypothetical protein